jgi:hypothetical protein
MTRVRVLVGTKKGAFILASDGNGSDCTTRDPHLGVWGGMSVLGSPVNLRCHIAQAGDDTLCRAVRPWAISALVALFAAYITTRTLRIRRVLTA